MSNTANIGTPLPGRTDQELEPLRVKWGWIVALGAVFVIAGLIALGSVVLATVASVAVVGAMMLVSGIAEIVNAFSVKSWGKFFLWALLGALYVVAGVVTFRNPLLAATVLTFMLGVALIVSGCLRIFLSMQMTQGTPWVWVALSGVVTLLVGGIILAHWPISSLFALGIFLGIDLVFAGAGWISMGLALRHRRT
ncbi:HdeD family acid-resistance protein [Microvirga calopogonii]|uniref:HdeD family acid-resistance protein n=1 Tax=Microvirga calopogonii TaxID=2078013 RepID=UPI000E0D4B63|nr:HdeD family acid-resistance protein [Microvirga calopogonii]